MTSLLSLPREIRDQIIDNVLLFHATPPLDLSAEDIRKQRQDMPECSAFPIRPAHQVYNAYSLFLVNSQLHCETAERLAKVPHAYKVDILFVSDDLLLPTWVFVPSRGDDIDTIEITFRTLQLDSPYLQALQQVFRQASTNGSQPAPISAVLLHILSVCTTASPSVDDSTKPDANYVKEIKFCIDTPSEVLQDCRSIAQPADFDRKHVGRLPASARPARPSWRTFEERAFWMRSTVAGLVRIQLSTHERIVEAWSVARRIPIVVDGHCICLFEPNLDLLRRVQRIKRRVAELTGNNQS